MLEQQVSEMLVKLSDALGVASEKIWEWALLQVKVEIVQGLIIIGVTIALWIAVYAVIKKAVKEEIEMDFDNDIWPWFVFIIGGIVMSVLSVVSLVEAATMAEKIINPEYAAFKNIISQLGKLK